MRTRSKRLFAPALICLVVLATVVNSALLAPDYSDYSEPEIIPEGDYVDPAGYESPYGDYDELLEEETEGSSADQAGGDLSDYDDSSEEPGDLDTFFWSDHLDKFGGSAVKEYAHAATVRTQVSEEEEQAGQAELEGLSEETRSQVLSVMWWLRSTDFHRDYWPVEVKLTPEGRQLSIQGKLLPAEQGSSNRGQQSGGWPYLHLVARESIPVDEIVLSVPLDVAIQAEGLAPDGVPPPPENLQPSASLAAWLLRERAAGDKSKWSAFLKLLPEKVPLPFLWSEEQLEALDFAPARGKAKEMAEQVKTLHSGLDPLFIASASLEQFKAAMSVALSHEVVAAVVPDGLPWDGSKANVDFSKEEPPIHHFLVPFGDFAEFSPAGEASWQVRSLEEGSFLCLVAETAIEDGEPIRVMLDSEDSTSHLLYRGKVFLQNPQDEFVVFGPTEQVVTYYADNFVQKKEASPMRAKKNPSEHRKKDPGLLKENFKTKVLQVAEEVVQLVMPGSHIPYVFGSKAYIDPRLWAVYAVCSFFKDHIDNLDSAEINVPVLARLSVELSQNHDLTCETLLDRAADEFPTASDERLQDVVDSLEDAAYYIKQLAHVWLQGFSTSFEEDEKTLARSQQCFCASKPSDSLTAPGPGGCPPGCEIKSISRESELAIRFRMNRKRLLRTVIEHLGQICPDEPAQA